MKDLYETPELEIVSISATDIILASGTSEESGDDSGGGGCVGEA